MLNQITINDYLRDKVQNPKSSELTEILEDMNLSDFLKIRIIYRLIR